jgi:hypothetical protein
MESSVWFLGLRGIAAVLLAAVKIVSGRLLIQTTFVKIVSSRFLISDNVKIVSEQSF